MPSFYLRPSGKVAKRTLSEPEEANTFTDVSSDAGTMSKTSETVADRPHGWTIWLSIAAAIISISSVVISYLSLQMSRKSVVIAAKQAQADLQIDSAHLNSCNSVDIAVMNYGSGHASDIRLSVRETFYKDLTQSTDAYQGQVIYDYDGRSIYWSGLAGKSPGTASVALSGSGEIGPCSALDDEFLSLRLKVDIVYTDTAVDDHRPKKSSACFQRFDFQSHAVSSEPLPQ